MSLVYSIELGIYCLFCVRNNFRGIGILLNRNKRVICL